MSLVWSLFDLFVPTADGYMIKNLLTEAVVLIPRVEYDRLNEQIEEGSLALEQVEPALLGENQILVDADIDEMQEFIDHFHVSRELDATTLAVHFVPTVNCQLNCGYCFERGGDRSLKLSDTIYNELDEYLQAYIVQNPVLDRLKLVLFGGEPLLKKAAIYEAVPVCLAIAEKFGLEFTLELVSNAELLDREMAAFLHDFGLSRLQVTLDGPREIHDQIRTSRAKRPTFDTIMYNVIMMLDGGYIDKVDLRLNFSAQTAEHIPALLEYLAGLELQNRVNLSFGILTPNLGDQEALDELVTATAYLSVCMTAQKHGFTIPEQFVTGLWCVATEKHGLIIQPDGTLQKCISTVGRAEYNFGHLRDLPESYARDERFERFSRMDRCLREKCAYLPLCGGGCIWDALVRYGEDGFNRRICQKELVAAINHGLMKLNYE